MTGKSRLSVSLQIVDMFFECSIPRTREVTRSDSNKERLENQSDAHEFPKAMIAEGNRRSVIMRVTDQVDRADSI